MKPSCASRVGLVGVALLLGGQVAERSAEAAHAKTNQHCLWKVEGPTTTVYLLGSIHFLKGEYYPLAKPIEAAFQQARKVVFETDFKKLQSPQTQAKMLKLGMCPQGKTIKDYLAKDTYQALQRTVEEKLGTRGAFDPMKPWLAAVSLMAIELQALGFNPEQGVDNHFFERAEKDQKEIIPLETVEFQLSLFGELTDRDQESLLRQTLDEVGQFKKEFAEITLAWQTGDGEKLGGLLLESMRDYPRIYQKLLVDRNRAWLSKIERLLAEDAPAFVVVGAGHLVGKDSLTSMLKKKGFKVQQL